MILKKTSDIMLTGIAKFNQEFNATSDQQTQIHVSMLPDGTIVYKKALDWEPKDVVKFTEIMDVKFDILGFQSLARPVMQQSIVTFAEELNLDIEKVSVFIFENQAVVYLAVYNENNFVKHLSLKQHFINLGITEE